jgi:hypothetical protein
VRPFVVAGGEEPLGRDVDFGDEARVGGDQGAAGDRRADRRGFQRVGQAAELGSRGQADVVTEDRGRQLGAAGEPPAGGDQIGGSPREVLDEGSQAQGVDHVHALSPWAEG